MKEGAPITPIKAALGESQSRREEKSPLNASRRAALGIVGCREENFSARIVAGQAKKDRLVAQSGSARRIASWIDLR
jgi:hypothetical protein